MADEIQINSTTDAYGQSYTSSVSNDKLTNDDFLKLMIEEIKMQDPTKPMDSAEIMDSQLKMSTIESNLAMGEAMAALQQSYANSALSTAANLVGHIVEDGSVDADGVGNSFVVETIESQDGELYVNARQMIGYNDILTTTDPDTEETSLVLYDGNGFIYEDGEPTEYRVEFDSDGRFTFNEDGGLNILDTDGNIVTDEDITSKYSYGGSQVAYSEETLFLPLSSIVKVR